MEAILGLVVGFVFGQAVSGWLAGLFFAGLGLMMGLIWHGVNVSRGRRERQESKRMTQARHAPDQAIPRPAMHDSGLTPAAAMTAAVPASKLAPGWTTASTVGVVGSARTEQPTEPKRPSASEARQGVADMLAPVTDRLAWLWQGNVFAKFGALLLFVGIAYLLRYAAQYITIPPAARITGAALLGASLVGVGTWLHRTRAAYAVILEGLGVAVLYLTAYAALALYRLIDTPVALTAMVAVSMGTVALALWQRSQVLAVTALSGGFLAPIVASTGTSEALALLSYYTTLNLVVALIAWFRRWPVLTLVGFLFTFVLGFYWADEFFRPAYAATTLPFAIAHYAIYLGVTVLFSRRSRPPETSEPTDQGLAQWIEATLLFGVPAAGMGLFARLLEGMPTALASVCVALALVYASLAWWCHRGAVRSSLLTQSFTALAIVFATIAAPIGLTAQWSSAIWAVQGAAVLWVALRQRFLAGAFLALLLQYAAIVAYLIAVPERLTPILNPAWLGALTIALALGSSSVILARFAHGDPKSAAAGPAEAASTITFMTAMVVWVGAGISEIRAFAAHADVVAAACLLITCTYLALGLFARLVPWTIARLTLHTAMPLLLAGTILTVTTGQASLHGLGWWAWSLAFVAAGVRVATPVLAPAHPAEKALLGWAIAIFGGHEAWQWTRSLGWHGTGWMTIAPVAVAWSMVCISEGIATMKGPTPGHTASSAWQRGFVVPTVVLLALFTLLIQGSSQHAATPLPYLPIVNPVDAFSLGVILMCLRSVRRTGVHPATLAWLTPAIGALAFIVLTAGILRCVHQWTGIDYSWTGMASAALAQTALSLTWSVVALGLMLAARNLRLQGLWMTGATLLALVAAKFIWFDFAHRSSLEGIIAMIGVGALFLVVGYLAPMPPKELQNQA